jgi:hypothetical protein
MITLLFTCIPLVNPAKIGRVPKKGKPEGLTDTFEKQAKYP